MQDCFDLPDFGGPPAVCLRAFCKNVHLKNVRIHSRSCCLSRGKRSRPTKEDLSHHMYCFVGCVQSQVMWGKTKKRQSSLEEQRNLKQRGKRVALGFSGITWRLLPEAVQCCFSWALCGLLLPFAVKCLCRASVSGAICSPVPPDFMCGKISKLLWLWHFWNMTWTRSEGNRNTGSRTLLKANKKGWFSSALISK